MTADLWLWQAVYDDGTVVPEYDTEGNDVGFLNLDHERLKHFALVSQREGLPDHAMTRTDPETKLVFLRRRSISTEEDDGPVVHILGMEKDGIGHYTFYFVDGSSLVSDDVDTV